MTNMKTPFLAVIGLLAASLITVAPASAGSPTSLDKRSAFDRQAGLLHDVGGNWHQKKYWKKKHFGGGGHRYRGERGYGYGDTYYKPKRRFKKRKIFRRGFDRGYDEGYYEGRRDTYRDRRRYSHRHRGHHRGGGGFYFGDGYFKFRY